MKKNQPEPSSEFVLWLLLEVENCSKLTTVFGFFKYSVSDSQKKNTAASTLCDSSK